MCFPWHFIISKSLSIENWEGKAVIHHQIDLKEVLSYFKGNIFLQGTWIYLKSRDVLWQYQKRCFMTTCLFRWLSILAKFIQWGILKRSYPEEVLKLFVSTGNTLGLDPESIILDFFVCYPGYTVGRTLCRHGTKLFKVTSVSWFWSKRRKYNICQIKTDLMQILQICYFWLQSAELVRRLASSKGICCRIYL